MISYRILIALLLGVALLYFSSDIVVEKLVLSARILGVSAFSIGFIVSSIGSDLPEIVNGIVSSLLGHGDIAIANSIGSTNTQLVLLLGIIPFFCTFCRLIPRPFFIVGGAEIIALFFAVVLSVDGRVTRLDAFILIAIWVISIILMRRYGVEDVAVEESEEHEVKEFSIPWTALGLVLGFAGIGIGSYLVVESAIIISDIIGVSEFFVSYFLLSIGTGLPEMVVAVSAIRKRYYELAVGDIVGSCIVDLTLSIAIASLIRPLDVRSREVLLSGSYALIIHSIVIGLLVVRRINDKRSGLLFILLYLSTYLIPILFF